MADMKDRAREYLRSQTQLNGGGLFNCNVLNLILGFAEQETKELQENYKKRGDIITSLENQLRLSIHSDKLAKAKEYIRLLLMNCVGVYESTGKTIAEIQVEAEQFLKEE